MMKAHSVREFLVTWIIALGLGTGFFCLIFFLIGDYSLRGWLNGLFPVGFAMLLLTLQVYIHRSGVFDVIFYSFFRLRESWKPGEGKRYDSAYDYHSDLAKKRSIQKPYSLPFFVISGFFLLASLVLLIIGSQ
jgi:hypothetical protein